MSGMEQRLPPHPLMTTRYRDNAEKRRWLRSIFDDTAADYDRVESWLSLGSGRWYRRQALKRAGLAPGMVVADVACGTGLVSREALTIIGPSGRLVGVDPSEGMRSRARRHLGIEAIEGLAEALPFNEPSFDFVSMGYALRHVADLHLAFSEFHRVLRPGGRLCVLEITRPHGRVRRAVLRGYLSFLSGVVCRLSRVGRRTPELWAYYLDTIERCVPPSCVVEAIERAGFSDVAHRMQLGLFSEYSAVKTEQDTSGC